MHRNSEQTPTSAGDPRVATLVSWLPESAVETWEERAAIRQFDAGYTKRDAEIDALLDVLVSRGPPARVFRLDSPNGSQWLLCCDAQRVADLGRELQAEASRTVLLNDEALALLASLASKGKSPWLFPNEHDPEKAIVNVDKAWRRILARAAAILGEVISDVRIHDLRHSFASQLANANCSLHVIAQALGHRTVSQSALVRSHPQRCASGGFRGGFSGVQEGEAGGGEQRRSNGLSRPKNQQKRNRNG